MLKRTFDFVVSFLVILIALPLWLAVVMAIKIDSAGPVFHHATRIGKGGKPFTLYKFRTMVADAASRGPGITQQDDPRISRVGRFLRQLKIDEMPQLINVLHGERGQINPGPALSGVMTEEQVEYVCRNLADVLTTGPASSRNSKPATSAPASTSSPSTSTPTTATSTATSPTTSP